MTYAVPQASTSRSYLSRLPLVRNRNRFAIGAVILVLCMLAASVIYGNASNRVEVIALARTVEQGHVITAGDLRMTRAAIDSSIHTVAASQEKSIIGRTTTARLLQGTLITHESISTTPNVDTGKATVSAALKVGQFPASMNVGDPVLLVADNAASVPAAGLTSSMQAIRGVVASVSTPERNSDTTSASFAVDEGDAPLLAIAGSQSKIAVVTLPR